jgi:hypothetical protein
MVMGPSHAAISGAESSTDSLSQGLTDYSSEDLATLQTAYQSTNTELASKKTKAAALKARLDAKDPTASQTEYVLLLQDIVDLQERAKNLQTLLASADTGSSSDNGSSSNNSSSGNSGNSMMDAIKTGAIQGVAQSLFGGQGGQGGLGNALSGLTNIANLNSGNVQLGTAAGSTGSIAKPATSKSQAKGDTSPAPKDKSCDDSGNVAAAKAALPERDDSGKIIKSSGKATTDTAPGKAADDAIAAKPAGSKPACKGVNYTQKNPEGTDGAPNELGVSSPEEAMALIESRGGTCDHETGLCKGGGCMGVSCQCAAFTRTEIPYSTADWREGAAVTRDTKIGTYISTFNNGNKYGTDTDIYGKSGFSHTGMFMGFNEKTGAIKIMDQYMGASLGIREYQCGGLEGCDKYHIIKTPGSSSWLEKIDILKPVWLALNLPPVGMGLLKS